ncbi:hypothetical protein ACSQ67_018811 [Phaseolus vulgaris]
MENLAKGWYSFLCRTYRVLESVLFVLCEVFTVVHVSVPTILVVGSRAWLVGIAQNTDFAAFGGVRSVLCWKKLSKLVACSATCGGLYPLVSRQFMIYRQGIVVSGEWLEVDEQIVNILLCCHRRSRMDQVQKPGMSTSNGGTTGFDFDEIVSNVAHLPYHQPKGRDLCLNLILWTPLLIIMLYTNKKDLCRWQCPGFFVLLLEN